MKTYISDNFPLEKLECQFFDICKGYTSNLCGYNQTCPSLIVVGDRKAYVRDVLKQGLENFVEVDNLKFQIELILNEDK